MRTLDGDPRTGMFPQTQVTTGDTTCSVKGVIAAAKDMFNWRINFGGIMFGDLLKLSKV